jgi:hypothetical protein
MLPRYVAAAAALLLMLAATASAQVKVDISFRRTLYMMYEPLVCTVTIQNMDSRPLELADTPRDKWFTVQVETVDGRPLPPINTSYKNEPMTLQPGQKLTRPINLTPLFPFEFGTYRVQAAVYSSQLKKYFSSPQLNVEITEGRKIYEETVGVPAGEGEGAARTFTLLVHRLPNTTVLYVRVQDRDAGRIYCNSPLGRFLSYGSPEVQFDAQNHIHILQNAAPKIFLHSELDINGKVLNQTAIQVNKAKPVLSRKPDGTIVTLGGTPYDPKATPPSQQVPKLTDRPIPLPTPQGKVPKQEPEDKRPENLLSR